MALNPAELPVSVTLPRGWWVSVIEAVRGAGEEYELLARDLQEFVIAATPQATFEPRNQGGPVRKGVYSEQEAREEFIPYGENGPEPMVPRVVQAQPHAVRQNDLVEALRAVADRFPGHTEINHVLIMLARELVRPQ